MNRFCGIGRLTRDPEIRYTAGENQMAVARYTLAIDRRFKKDSQQNADFISCVAFGKNAEFAENYLRQGMKIAIEGRIQTGSYPNKEGKLIYTTDIVVENHEFCETKSQTKSEPSQNTGNAADEGFLPVPDAIQEELPFRG